MIKQILFEMKKLNNLLARKLFLDFKVSSDVPFSIAQIHIIGYLFHNQSKEIYQKQLEEELKIRKSTISGILRTMEKHNMIERIGKDSDGRLKQIVLTNKALLLKEDMDKKCSLLEEKLCLGIDKEDLETFYRVIIAMKNNLRRND